MVMSRVIVFEMFVKIVRQRSESGITNLLQTDETEVKRRQKKAEPRVQPFKNRAKNGTRTRDPQLGKLMLYQLSYFRNWILVAQKYEIFEKNGKSGWKNDFDDVNCGNLYGKHSFIGL